MKLHPKKARKLKLDNNSSPTGSVRFLTSLHVKLDEGKNTSVITLTRTGRFFDPRYGTFDITREMLLSMVKNFDSGVYGQDIFIDVAHKPENGAAAKVLSLSIEGNRLRARVEWTEYGADAVKNKGYVYLSAEYHENFKDNEARAEHGPTLLGAGLTIRPVIKNLDPVDPDSIELSEDFTGQTPTLIHPNLIKELSEAGTMKWITLLRKKLVALKLSESQIKAIIENAEATAKALGELTADQENALAAQFENAGKQLAEAIAAGTGEVKLSIDVAGIVPGSGDNKLSEDDINTAVTKALAKAKEDDDAKARKLAEDLDGNLAIFDDALDKVKGLSEDNIAVARQGRDLITAAMTAEQVTKLAEHQIKVANELESQKQLSNMGFGATGSIQMMTPGAAAGAQALQEQIDGMLKKSALAKSLSLDSEQTAFVDNVLTCFDVANANRMLAESKVLSGEQTQVSDTDLPLGFQRTVIREALHDLRVLELVQTLTDANAQATTQIPYELRDDSAIKNDGIVYEGQGIPGASIEQKMDLAYVLPMKIAMTVTNEVMHFTRSSAINWDAWARNVESNARILRELVVRRIANEMQRTADSFSSQSVTGESIAARLDGSNSIIKTSVFPIVRPHQQFDLAGNNVGSVENPISIVIDGTAVEEFDGTGNQAAGIYFRLTNLNLGFIQLVDQAGSAVTPNATAATISYSRATNVQLVDVKVDAADKARETIEVAMNHAIRGVGRAKALLSGDRYVNPDFALMSPTLNDEITNAEMFTMSTKRDGSDTGSDGDLERVKGIGTFGTNAPGIDLGDERIIIGQRGTTAYTVAKAYSMAAPFEAVNAAGQPTGKKISYGEEYNSIWTPKPIRNRYRSVIVYDSESRDAV